VREEKGKKRIEGRRGDERRDEERREERKKDTLKTLCYLKVQGWEK
jgi:hypothetical protein